MSMNAYYLRNLTLGFLLAMMSLPVEKARLRTATHSQASSHNEQYF